VIILDGYQAFGKVVPKNRFAGDKVRFTVNNHVFISYGFKQSPSITVKFSPL